MFHVKQLHFAVYIFLIFSLFLPAMSLPQDFKNANELYFQGELEKAISAYTELIEKEPENISIWVNLALVYRDLGLYSEAISSLKHISYIPPSEKTAISQEEILNLLAWLYYYSGKIKEAEDTFYQVLHSTIPPFHHSTNSPIHYFKCIFWLRKSEH